MRKKPPSKGAKCCFVFYGYPGEAIIVNVIFIIYFRAEEEISAFAPFRKGFFDAPALG